MRRAEGAPERAERFLFDPANALAVAVFRIGLAGMIAVVFRRYGAATALVPGFARFSSVRAFEDTLFASAAYEWLILAAAVALGLGWRARAASAALVVLLFPLVFRAGRLQGRLTLWLALVSF